jgi:hypothetical protein
VTLRRRSMQYAEYRVPRIPLLRGSVNRATFESAGPPEQRLGRSKHDVFGLPPARDRCGYTLLLPLMPHRRRRDVAVKAEEIVRVVVIFQPDQALPVLR